ncbi:50S ribosomal protein L16 [Candidatus Azambacteria bacterium RIFCSPHIGHO2_01_46_10]|uniref:Large ribosomal subunit protein uL16 n=7 Tax=Parcubacteria group TaxID=1794811 RepID=A0A1F5C6L5_9BACT|nr:MAG: 50S ribosomal protein L16 [Candidatus Azambacteria bacterium GW2011_GWA2_45_90]KKU20959.1 MAG: ribosomal protein L16, large subunit ribosomal protein L16 [Candidatus Azambacteria bacterium GW2011_GWC1_46_13]OGD30209.1 MAG: 50S ribosomal protein L16 [Candidatus Azambacteria bacterium RIFCSPHIGHO2_02_46_12]OGD35454.1 MAG: 50S ribosomal protein L16 [Candidatus Azambacteria bacterium RIFCSPHIGHO2_01_46_10]OGD38493.1 MAG: 50S ribosomal protein L16 [Candidatus Azambacteria bacterium RIFCSPLOW
MLLPKKVKHRKWQKGRNRFGGVETRGTELAFGGFGLQSLGSKWITGRQIEAARRAMTRFIKREGKVWIRIFPDRPVTKKGQEVGMGSGKGAVDHYVVPVKPGRVLFEMDGISEDVAKEAMRLASHKLPIKTRFVKR